MQLAEEVEQVVRRKEILELQLAGEEAYLAPHLLGLAHHAAAVELGVAAVGLDQGAEHAQRGGLACTVGAQQTEYLTALGAESQVVHGHLLLGGRTFYLLLLPAQRERLAEPLNFQYLFHYL